MVQKRVEFCSLLLIVAVLYGYGIGMVDISQVYCLFWQFYTVFFTVMVLECLKFHSFIVYFDSSTQFSTRLWSWNAWKVTVLLLHCYELVLHWVILAVYEAWWVLCWLFSLLTLKGGYDEDGNVMHWLTCGLGRGCPTSDSLTLSGWSSAVTSANTWPNPLHDWIDCGWCLRGLLWSMRRWTPIPGSEVWSNQVFNCVGISRTSDVCSKHAEVLWSYNFLVKCMMRFLTLFESSIF